VHLGQENACWYVEDPHHGWLHVAHHDSQPSCPHGDNPTSRRPT
jgi:hypothetical protein